MVERIPGHNDYPYRKEKKSMNRKFILLCFFLILVVVYSGSSSNTTGEEKNQPEKSQTWCDDHPEWNLCQHRDRLDSSDLMDHDNLVYSTPVKTSEEPKNRLEICEEIVKKYNDTHIYQKNNYDCDDMTLDIWNQLKKQYINAKIGLGNVTHEADNLWESSHAWVIAEFEPDKWIALEGIGGNLVYKTDNPLYYTGWFFDTPMEYKKYRELVDQYKEGLTDVNQLIREFNNTSLLDVDGRKNQEVVIDDRVKKMKELETKIIALSQGVKASNLNLFENNS